MCTWLRTCGMQGVTLDSRRSGIARGGPYSVQSDLDTAVGTSRRAPGGVSPFRGVFPRLRYRFRESGTGSIGVHAGADGSCPNLSQG